jgi:type IV pilus assembly protein PilA
MGRRVVPYCAYCGTEVDAAVAACPHCGHPQRGAGVAGPSRMQPQQTEGTAIASLVTGLIGCFPAGLILGIVALRRIKNDPTKTGQGLAIGGIVLSSASLLMIPVMIAIAIPTFLGARTRAQDRATESSLRNSVTAAKAIFTEREDYRDVTVAAMAESEPSLLFVEGPSVSPTTVSVLVVDRTEVRFAALSASGACIAVRDTVSFEDPNPGTSWAEREGSAACEPSMFAPAEFGDDSPSSLVTTNALSGAV